MSPINCDDLHRIFNKLDKNGDGFVSIDELKSLLDGIGVPTSLVELETLVGKKTLNLVDFWIFYDVIIKRSTGDHCRGEASEEEEREKMESDLVKAFRVFDTNGDGFISCEEVQSALSRLGLWDKRCGGNCRSMIEFYDTNGDGLLDFEEFKSMMLLTNS